MLYICICLLILFEVFKALFEERTQIFTYIFLSYTIYTVHKYLILQPPLTLSNRSSILFSHGLSFSFSRLKYKIFVFLSLLAFIRLTFYLPKPLLDLLLFLILFLLFSLSFSPFLLQFPPRPTPPLSLSILFSSKPSSLIFLSFSSFYLFFTSLSILISFFFLFLFYLFPPFSSPFFLLFAY